MLNTVKIHNMVRFNGCVHIYIYRAGLYTCMCIYIYIENLYVYCVHIIHIYNNYRHICMYDYNIHMCVYIYTYTGSRPKVPRRQSGHLLMSKMGSSFSPAFHSIFCLLSMLSYIIFLIMLCGRKWMSSEQHALAFAHFFELNLSV